MSDDLVSGPRLAQPRTVGLIGAGLIGTRVLRELDRGQLPGWKLASVLARRARSIDAVDIVADPEEFFAHDFDLVIDAAGPEVLRQYGPRALAQADVWTVSGTALSDTTLVRQLETIGARSGHRLRVLPGAIGGLDGIATLTNAFDAEVHAIIDLVPSGDETREVFVGTAAEAAARFPNHVNVAVATALAGLGLDRTSVTVRQPRAGDPHTLQVEVQGQDGTMTATTNPVVSPTDGVHIVASAIIVALRTADQVIWVG